MQFVEGFHPWVRRLPEQNVFLHTYPRSPSEAELAEYVAACVEHVETLNAPYTVVADLRRLDTFAVDARHRRAFANLQEALHEHDAKWNRGIALVVDSPIHRGLITAVHWLKPPVYPYMFSSSVIDATRYGRDQLAGRLRPRISEITALA